MNAKFASHFLLLVVFTSHLCATAFTLFPPDKVIYHVTGATLISLVKMEDKRGQDRIALAFAGEWLVDRELRGAQIKPQAGVVICADAAERKRNLEELRLLASSLVGKKVDIYIYGGSTSHDRATYTLPELIKIVPTPKA